ncbi:DUF885 family protein [Sphingomonas sp. LHG3406-1]|uniref:DUF885 domain-containing protein n=1 Tax=Sphingomonas sp. LHG3406-1 TaxID=2804617 RepID=UPI00263455C7|nr:DUF885 domain-containing protein [Sphingomonas sp. LHG3406-1]
MTVLTRRQALAAAASCVPLAACATRPAAAPLASAPPPVPVQPVAAREAEAAQLLDAIAENLLRLQPESATSLGIDKDARAAMRSRLSDRSASGQRMIEATLRYDLARAESFPQDGLSYSTRTSFEVVKSAYRTALAGFALPYGDVPVGGWRNSPYVVIQNVGAYLDIPRFLDSEHQVKSREDAQSWLARLGQYRAALDGELERMRAARAVGLIPPSFLLDKALPQIETSATGVSLTRLAMERLKELPGGAKEAARIIAEEVRPALLRQIEELKAQRAVASDAPGMSARPGGAEYYRWALKASTTTDLSPEEIHQIGLTELRELQGRMDPILRSLGFTQGSVGERMQALGRDPRYRFSDGDKGRAEILAFIDERVRLVRAKLPQMFNTLVRGNLEVRRLPPEEEPGAPGAYGGAGSIDGTIPGKFWINLRTTELHTKFDLPDLTHHEAIPGHVWQGEYANKLPLIRTMLAFGAYSEGWALYAQQLADEFGLYEDFAAGRLGYLQGIAFRACRLVIDTGLHAKNWSREQAVRFFMDENGTKEPEARSEVDRYCSWPGQACGYKIGHTAINRQRSRAQQAMGPAYDIRTFNDAVLLGGNVPMDVLALNVGEYIRQKGTPA